VPTDLWVALIGAGAAVLVAVAGGLVTLYAPDWKAQRDRRRQVEELEARYSDSLRRAANDLQSRFFNIVMQNFLDAYVQRGTEEDRFYAVTSTMWLVGQYFGWVQLLRRDAHSLALGGVNRGRELLGLLDEIDTLFATDRFGRSYRLWRAEQSALGELMIVERASDDARRFDCLGYASFVDSLQEPPFRRWFASLEDALREFRMIDAGFERLAHLQNALLDLTEFLYGGPTGMSRVEVPGSEPRSRKSQ
jgi:hypothetical protein